MVENLYFVLPRFALAPNVLAVHSSGVSPVCLCFPKVWACWTWRVDRFLSLLSDGGTRDRSSSSVDLISRDGHWESMLCRQTGVEVVGLGNACRFCGRKVDRQAQAGTESTWAEFTWGRAARPTGEVGIMATRRVEYRLTTWWWSSACQQKKLDRKKEYAAAKRRVRADWRGW